MAIKKTAPKSPRKKLDVNALLTAVLNHLTHHPPHKLTFSAISRLTNVPRPTLYYYFGNSPKTMLEEAVRFGLKAFVRMNSFDRPTKATDWHEFQKERLLDVMSLVRKYPWAPGLYFQYRRHYGEWGDLIRSIENEYVEKMRHAWKKFHAGAEPDARAVRMASYLKLGLLYGVTLEPDLWLKEPRDQVIPELIDRFSRMVTEMMSLKLD